MIRYDEVVIFSIAGLASVSDISSVKNIAMHLLSCNKILKSVTKTFKITTMEMVLISKALYTFIN